MESSGVPIVPNNLRSQTLDKSSAPSDNRRVRVSKWCTHAAAHWAILSAVDSNGVLTAWVCIFCLFASSPMERRALTVYTPVCLKKRLPAITGQTLALQLFPYPEPRCHQVSPLLSCFFFFFTSTLKQRDSCRCLAASQLTHTLYIWVTEAAASCNVMLDCVEKTLSSSTDC